MKHYLTSWNSDTDIQTFEVFDSELIKKAIIEWLTANPIDTLEHSKDLTPEEKKKYVGRNILDFYAVNPKSNKVSKIITKGEKEYYLSLEY